MSGLEATGVTTLLNAEEELKFQAPPTPGVGAGKTGTVIKLTSTEEGGVQARGDWAVTG